jgi:hypothetical protein
MKPISATTPRAAFTSLLAGGAAMLLLLGSSAPVSAGVGVGPQLSLVGGTGVPGGTVGVTLVLANDVNNVAVTAEVRIGFPTDSLEFFPPVATNCPIAQRLASTHAVGGTATAGQVHPNVFLSPIPPPPPPPYPRLGDGDIFTCNFHIPTGVPTGTVAVTIMNPCLGDTNGTCVPVTTVNGAVVVSNATPTFTPTSTPIHTPTATPTTPIGGGTPTATPTNTSGTPGTPTGTPTNTSGTPGTPTATHTSGTPGTPTATHTSGTPGTPTATHTSGTPGTPTATHTPIVIPTRHFKDSDSCSIVPIEASNSQGTLALLLAPALLLWARRKRF